MDNSQMIYAIIGSAGTLVAITIALAGIVWKAATITTKLTQLEEKFKEFIIELEKWENHINKVPELERRLGQVEELVKKIADHETRVRILEKRMSTQTMPAVRPGSYSGQEK